MNNRPWTALDPSVAAPLRPRVPTLVGEVIDAVQSAVPEYRELDPAVSRGVHVALDGFLDLVEGGDEGGEGEDDGGEVRVALEL